MFYIIELISIIWDYRRNKSFLSRYFNYKLKEKRINRKPNQDFLKYDELKP